MPFPCGPLTLTSPAGKPTLIVAREFCWLSVKGSPTITVAEGYETDGASIPRLFWRLIGGPFGKYREAAVIHDWLYSENLDHEYTRKQADGWFYEIMGELGVKQWRRWCMWKGVRVGGWLPWRRYRQASGP